jgi:hypothetical protein
MTLLPSQWDAGVAAPIHLIAPIRLGTPPTPYGKSRRQGRPRPSPRALERVIRGKLPRPRTRDPAGSTEEGWASVALLPCDLRGRLRRCWREMTTQDTLLVPSPLQNGRGSPRGQHRAYAFSQSSLEHFDAVRSLTPGPPQVTRGVAELGARGGDALLSLCDKLFFSFCRLVNPIFAKMGHPSPPLPLTHTESYAYNHLRFMSKGL